MTAGCGNGGYEEGDPKNQAAKDAAGIDTPEEPVETPVPEGDAIPVPTPEPEGDG